MSYRDKILAYDIEARLPRFIEELMNQCMWTEEYAIRVIEEYKRFCYVGRNVSAVPSQEIDLVWSLHLLYTEEYWEYFCPKILGMRLHRYPSDYDSALRHKYLDTIMSYSKEFGSMPPEDIWPNPYEAFNGNYITVDTTKFVIIKSTNRTLTSIIKKLIKWFG